MGVRVPHPPCSRSEFEARKAAGARTLAELDPCFWAWLQARRRERAWMVAGIGVSVLILVGAICVSLLSRSG